MSYLNLSEIKEELVIHLRNSDVLTTTQRGVTTNTEEFNGNDSDTDFVLTNTPVRNVRSITVGGASQSLGSDYTVDYPTSTVTFSTAPAAGTNNVDIQYDYGNSDKIFPDFPRPDLSISSFPRIGIDFLGVDTEPAGFGNANVSNIDFTVVVYDFKNLDVTTTIESIRQAIIASYNSFYYLKNIRPLRIGPMIKSPFVKGKDKILQQNIDFKSMHNYEIN